MKKLFPVVILLVLTSLATIARADWADSDGVTDSPLGNVVAVKRAFRIDLGECERNYQVNIGSSERTGSCQVTVLPSTPREMAADQIYSSLSAVDSGGRNIGITLSADANSYTIKVASFGDADLSFSSVRGALQAVVKNLPEHEVRSVVFKIER